MALLYWFFGCFGASIGYLATRKSHLDIFARHEVGLMFGAIVLTTGPLWARCVGRLVEMGASAHQHGTPDSHLFASYWVLRVYGGRGEGIRKFSAFLAVLATPNIYFVENGCQEMAR